VISCTEFIPAYSVLFDFLEKKGGHEAVVAFWNTVSDKFVAPKLGKLVAEKGILGCWEYWGAAHTSEAADVTLSVDTDKGEMTIDMHCCPSKGRLIQLKHMKPYHDYCGHCLIIYKKVLDKYGIVETRDHDHVDEARCYRIYRAGEVNPPGD
jgi:hypothetical protein